MVETVVLPLAAPDFVQVPSLDRIGMVAANHFAEAFPAEGGLPPVNIYALRGARLGGNGLLRLGDALFHTRDTTPGYYAQPAPVWLRALMRDDVQVLGTDMPMAVLIQPNWVYGHVLLEMLPKMFLHAQLALAGRRFPVAVSREAPPFLRRLLSLYVPPEMVLEYDPDTQQVAAPLFIIPSLMNWHYRLHPMVNAMVEDILTRCLLRPQVPLVEILPPRVFLSRVRLPAQLPQRVGDPRAVEAVFSRHGFAVIYPETLDFAQQMALFARCDVLAGVAGSALHNSLFARRGATVISVGHRNHIQQEICTLRGQHLSVLAAGEDPDTYVVDPPALEQELVAALALL